MSQDQKRRGVFVTAAEMTQIHYLLNEIKMDVKMDELIGTKAWYYSLVNLLTCIEEDMPEREEGT